MLRSIVNKVVSFSILGFLLPGALSVASQETSCPRKQSAFAMVHDLLEASYPEMFGKDWHIGFSYGQPVDGHEAWGQTYLLDFRVARFGPGVSWNPTFYQGKRVPPPDNPTFLEGSFWMDNSDRVVRLIVEGDLAYSKQNQAIRELVQSHAEWSEEEAIGALKKSGARYGPADKQQFLEAIHLEKFERSLGHLEIRLVEFQGLSSGHVGSFAAGSLFWVVQARGGLPDGIHCTYGFSFEPLAGKLTGVSRIGDRDFPSEKQPATQP
jgi:hypothetical protein